jgi:hypothetical protein
MTTVVYDVHDLLSSSKLGRPLPDNLASILASKSIKSLDSFIKKNGLGFDGFDDFVLQVITSESLELLKQLIESGMDINVVTAYGPLILMAFRSGKVRHAVIMCILNYQVHINLDFKIKYANTEANFYDLAIFLCPSEAILNAFTDRGALPQNPQVIPYAPNPHNVDHNMYILRMIYAPTAIYNKQPIIDYLISPEIDRLYYRYAPWIADLTFDAKKLSITTKLLMIARLTREHINQPVVTLLLAALPKEIMIDEKVLPTKYLDFDDLVAAAKTARANSVKVTIDPNYIVNWMPKLQPSGRVIDELLSLMVDFNSITDQVRLSGDWQMLLIQRRAITNQSVIKLLFDPQIYSECQPSSAKKRKSRVGFKPADLIGSRGSSNNANPPGDLPPQPTQVASPTTKRKFKLPSLNSLSRNNDGASPRKLSPRSPKPLD